MATISDLLKFNWNELTKSDKKVGRALLSAYPLAGLETLADLAERAQVSVPSVIRCIKKLGFDGYPEFQKALHREIQIAMSSLLTTDNSGTPAAPETQHDVDDGVRLLQQSIAETFDRVQLSELRAVANLLSDPRSRILVVGGIVSQVLARYFHTYMIRIRPNIDLVENNPLERSERLLDINKKDIVVVFDFPNYDNDNISFARLAKERNAAVVLFTDQAMSPISNFADSVITSSTKSASLFNSMVPAMSILEALFSELVLIIGTKARDRIKRLSGVPGDVAVNWDREHDDDVKAGAHHSLIGRLT
ncbi:MurR/RpiR family transcriptional regulator [Exilibacterium tricleocarpae]|uniref:MurR/RpiR family transcriptional regulator n=1 Tax=Exilibacterium tricleocarpae TaxID=2591008 RepID=A0A545TLM9_9GAMM|nr:MurR/RpiR family transcriptional regulator [Exilibacterium tricleocarpae]TQV78129.1 MurR/RpiR family transcriptional regulator [Exilibacterium tricleocarpae]